MKRTICFVLLGAILFSFLGCQEKLPPYEPPVVTSSQSESVVTQDPIIIVTTETETEVLDPEAPTAPFDRVYSIPSIEDFKERFAEFITGEWEEVYNEETLTEVKAKTKNDGELTIMISYIFADRYEFQYPISDIDEMTDKISEVIAIYLRRNLSVEERAEIQESIGSAMLSQTGYEVMILRDSLIDVYIFASDNYIYASFV